MSALLRNLWQSIAALRPGSGSPQHDLRWVVVDVETTGLDAKADSLLAIGAVAVRREGIDPGDSFEAVIRPSAISDRENILVHRIGAQQQAAGEPAAEACKRFLAFVGDAPLVGYHLSFDQAFLSKAIRAAGLTVPKHWLDLAELAPALHPASDARALDDWLALVEISVKERHSAVSDALATAMLFQWLLARTTPADRHFKALKRLARSARWVAPANRR